MSASGSSKKQCVTCSKGAGIFTCDGCQQAFCTKHVSEHRQELNGQLDNIMQDCDLLQQELLEPSSKKNPVLQEIDEWEKNSIAKIQAAAETARTALKELLEQSKERVSKVFLNIAENLRSSHEADDFSEIDLDLWKKKLKELQAEIESPSSAMLIQNKRTPIYLMKLEVNDASKAQQEENKGSRFAKRSNDTHLQEQFLEKLGAVLIATDGYLATHGDTKSEFVYLRGRLAYSAGCYAIRFKIENFTNPYRIFIGCMSSKVDLKKDIFRSSSCVGWFGYNQVYTNGTCISNCQKTGYYSGKIQVNDVLQLILDCTSKQIRLRHERLNTVCTLMVNENLSPFPWQVLIILGGPGDTVRILPNA
ncbi:unnamed protein product [Rotaria socialis]|uniref:B box-type domain-containing protein n=1 Tax=Rotaria socialis TaxID=392032 RepID=A0A818QKE2_9BILA|nr:unnamed protein product [Rotaria socialis]CAF4459918.1 unnamed protein product [Rotaria socialis]